MNQSKIDISYSYLSFLLERAVTAVSLFTHTHTLNHALSIYLSIYLSIFALTVHTGLLAEDQRRMHTHSFVLFSHYLFFFRVPCKSVKHHHRTCLRIDFYLDRYKRRNTCVVYIDDTKPRFRRARRTIDDRFFSLFVVFGA